jgi:hypothetical protein
LLKLKCSRKRNNAFTQIEKRHFRFHSIHDHIDRETLTGVMRRASGRVEDTATVNIARKNQLPGAEKSQKGSAANDHLKFRQSDKFPMIMQRRQKGLLPIVT